MYVFNFRVTFYGSRGWPHCPYFNRQNRNLIWKIFTGQDPSIFSLGVAVLEYLPPSAMLLALL
jgi:hypothetical protein